MLRTRLLRAVARLWWLQVYVGSADALLPRDAPSIRSGAEGAHRVLVLGNGSASGWGVLTHGLGVLGRLAEQLQRTTGRPCDVDLLGDDVMNAGSAPEWIGDRPLDGYDVIVVMLGFSDALRQTPELLWRAELERLLHLLLDRIGPNAGLLVAGIERMDSAPIFRGPLRALGQRNADRLNAATRALVAQTSRAVCVELPPPVADGDRSGPGVAYEHWAGLLAQQVAPLLDPDRATAARPAMIADEPPFAPRTATDVAALQALVDGAKDELHVDLAWVGLHSGDRQVIAVSTERRSPASVPMDLTFCRYTEALDDTFVVPDAPADGRFMNNPFLDVLHLEAYAGHPLHGPDGEVVGTFCVATIRPRAALSEVSDRLERFARTAERQLTGPTSD